MGTHLLFHISFYKNLDSIFSNGELASHIKVQEQRVGYTNIAHQGLQERRSTTVIPVEPNGCLHDYVPFYFAPRSPMLYAIKQGRVKDFDGNQDDIVYFVTSTDKVVDAGLPFVFTDGHAIMFITDFYNDINDLDKVDWDIMKERYWNDTEEDPDRKRRRQAEFLIHEKIGLEHFLGIAVRNERMKEIVEDKVKNYKLDLPVVVRPRFYF